MVSRLSEARTGWCWATPARAERLALALALVAILVAVAIAGRCLLADRAFFLCVCVSWVGLVGCWCLLDKLKDGHVGWRLVRAHLLDASGKGRVTEWFRGLKRRPHPGQANATDVRSNDDGTGLTKLLYVGLLTALLVLLGAMPTLSLADLTYRWTIGEEAEAEVAHLRGAWRARQEAITAEYHSDATADARRSDLGRDFYASERFAATLQINEVGCPAAQAGPPATASWFLDLGDAVTRLLPAALSGVTPSVRPDGRREDATVCAEDPRGPSKMKARFEAAVTSIPVSGAPRFLVPWVILLALACWLAVELFQRRVYGFLDLLPTLPPAHAKPDAPPNGLADDWQRCSPAEKEVLRQVARKDLLRRHDKKVADALVEKGLIQFQPLPRVDVQLADYVLSIPPAGEPGAARPRTRVAWRPILTVALLGTSAFIFLTQQDASIALVTGLSSIVPSLARIIDTLTGRARGDKAE